MVDNSPEIQADGAEITVAELYALAPTVIPNHRTRRYHGDDVAISMEEFVAADRETIRELYRMLMGLFTALQGHGEGRERTALAFMEGCARRWPEPIAG